MEDLQAQDGLALASPRPQLHLLQVAALQALLSSSQGLQDGAILCRGQVQKYITVLLSY